jgi:hypothetical protein
MYNNDITSKIPQFERKSIVSRAPAGDLPALGFFTQLQKSRVVEDGVEHIELDASTYPGDNTFTTSNLITSTNRIDILLTTSDELRNRRIVITFTAEPVLSATFGGNVLTVDEAGNVNIPPGTFTDEVNKLELVFVNTISAGSALEATISVGPELVEMDMSSFSYPDTVEFTGTAPPNSSTLIRLNFLTNEIFRTNTFDIDTNNAGVTIALANAYGPAPTTLGCTAGTITVPANTFTDASCNMILSCSNAVSSSDPLVFTITPIFEALAVDAYAWSYPGNIGILSSAGGLANSTQYVSLTVTTNAEINEDNMTFTTAPSSTGARFNSTNLGFQSDSILVPVGTFTTFSNVMKLQIADQMINGDTISLTISPDFQPVNLDASSWNYVLSPTIEVIERINSSKFIILNVVTAGIFVSPEETFTLTVLDYNSNTALSVSDARPEGAGALLITANVIDITLVAGESSYSIQLQLASLFDGNVTFRLDYIPGP